MSSPRKKSTLFHDEDWLTVWLALLVIVFVVAGLRPQMPELRWATEQAVAGAVAQNMVAAEELSRYAESSGNPETGVIARNLVEAMGTMNRPAIAAASEALSAAAKNTSDKELRAKAAQLKTNVGDLAARAPGRIFRIENLVRMIGVGLGYLILSAIGIVLMGGNTQSFIKGFPAVYLMAWLAQVVAGNSTVEFWGLEFVIFALTFGLVVGNSIGVPAWLKEAVKTDYFIKIGLVIFGAGILFEEVLQAGLFGLAQAFLVIVVVWYSCYYVSKKLRVDDEFAVLLSTAVSICGVSAAIAACGAIQGDRRKLSYVTSLVLIVAVPMLVLMPWIVRRFEIPDLVGGAWIGGTIDTSGAVVAAGGLVSEAAMKASVIVKFSQNALIGLAAFILSMWWTLKPDQRKVERPTARIIWQRFPKFVLGFMAASLIFSFVLDPSLVAQTRGTLTSLRTIWFALAFTCIGLETRFTYLFGMDGGRPAIAFLVAQAVNIAWTLILAYLLFGGVLFSVPRL